MMIVVRAKHMLLALIITKRNQQSIFLPLTKEEETISLSPHSQDSCFIYKWPAPLCLATTSVSTWIDPATSKPFLQLASAYSRY